MSHENRKSLEQDLLFAIVKDKYGHLLDDGQIEELRKPMMALSDFMEPLRAAPLTNDVEPAPIFRPFRSDRDDR